jgi:hypothetical protein
MLLWPLFLCIGWIAAALRGERPALGALGVVGLAWLALRLRTAARLRAALRQDAIVGVAFIVAASERDPEHEFLPSSGALWTVAGTPVGWRQMLISQDE